MTDDAPSRQQDKFVVRLPDGMRERIAAAAEAAGRSMNAELVKRISESFPPVEDELIARRRDELKVLSKALDAADERILAFKGKNKSAQKSAYLEHERLKLVVGSIEHEIDLLRRIRDQFDADPEEVMRKYRRFLEDADMRDPLGVLD